MDTEDVEDRRDEPVELGGVAQHPVETIVVRPAARPVRVRRGPDIGAEHHAQHLDDDGPGRFPRANLALMSATAS